MRAPVPLPSQSLMEVPTLTEATTTDRLVEQFTESLGRRVTRGTVLARFGKTLVAVSLGEVGLSYLAKGAYAHEDGCSPTVCCDTCGPYAPKGTHGGACCDGNLSVPCSQLPGGTNACPSGTTPCGYWDILNDPSCPSNHPNRRWQDCCGNCNNGSNCGCVNNQPSCCRHKAYPQNNCDCTCHIKCRHTWCWG